MKRACLSGRKYGKLESWSPSPRAGAAPVFLLLLPFLLAPVPGLGAEAGKAGPGRESKAFELGEIVITDEKSPASSVSTVTEVTREDFRSRGVNTVGEALRYVPGARVSLAPGSLSGNGKQEQLIRLRGFETTDILVLIDGMPMTEPYLKRVDLSQISLDSVAKIKVIKGPSSVLYGPNSAGGIVNIVTEQGEGLRTFLDQRFADYRSFRTLAQHQGAQGPVNWALGGSWDRSDGFPVSRDFEGARNQEGTLRANSDYERYNFAGRAGAELGKRRSVSMGGGYYSFDGGVPFSMSSLVLTDLWRKEWGRWYVNGFGEWAFTDRLGAVGQVFYNKFDNRLTTYTDTTFQEIKSGGNAVSTYDNSILGYFLNPYWDLGRASSLKAGIRYDKEVAEIQDETGAPWQRYAAEIYAYSLEDEVRPLENLSLVGGVGYSLYRKVEAYQRDPGDDIDSVDFQFGALYSPLSWLAFHGGVARKTSYPTMRDLYSENGNPNLKEQRALTYEVGLEVSDQGMIPGGSLALFRSDVDDLIGKKEEGTTFTFENVDRALLQGLELSGHWYPAEGLGLLANYTFLDTENKATGRDLSFQPPHVLNLEAFYLASFGLRGSVLFSYLSSQKYEPVGQPGQEADLPARGIWEIHLSQRFPFERRPERYLEVSVGVENLFDEYYEEDPRRAAPGRVVWAGLSAAF